MWTYFVMLLTIVLILDSGHRRLYWCRSWYRPWYRSWYRSSVVRTVGLDDCWIDVSSCEQSLNIQCYDPAINSTKVLELQQYYLCTAAAAVVSIYMITSYAHTVLNYSVSWSVLYYGKKNGAGAVATLCS